MHGTRPELIELVSATLSCVDQRYIASRVEFRVLLRGGIGELSQCPAWDP